MNEKEENEKLLVTEGRIIGAGFSDECVTAQVEFPEDTVVSAADVVR